MNHYVFYATIFDRDPNPNLSVFPVRFPIAERGDDYNEAQRSAIDEIFAPDGLLMKAGVHRDDEAADRFAVVFDKEPAVVRPIEWSDENGWTFADENV